MMGVFLQLREVQYQCKSREKKPFGFYSNISESGVR